MSPTGVRHWLEGRPSKKRTAGQQVRGAKLRTLEVVSDAPSKKRTYTASLRGGVEVRDLALSEVIELAKALS